MLVAGHDAAHGTGAERTEPSAYRSSATAGRSVAAAADAAGSSSLRKGGEAPARSTRARGDEGAEARRLDDRILLAELLAAEALRAPPGEEATAERVAGADRVDDLDRAARRPARRPRPVTTWTPSPPRVSSTTLGPACSSIRAAAAALRWGSSQARSSSETLTTSLRASTRRRRRR